MTDINFARLESEFRHLASELTPADRQRLALPQAVWPTIESATRRSNDRNVGNHDAQVLAAASLDNEGLPVGFGGGAEVEFRNGASSNELEIMVASLPPEIDGSYYELWMIDPVLEGMISLGPISVPTGNGGEETIVVTVPGGVDFERFLVIDLSIEPTDGDPTHSGQSILRGILEPVEDT